VYDFREQKAAPETVIHLMGYLRLVSPAAPTLESACLDAFDRELDYLFETIRRLGARPSDVEDLVQDVFVVLHRNWPTLDTTRSLRPYLFGVAFRIVCAHRRRHSREIPRPGLDAEDGGASPEFLAQSKESAGLLMAALERVPLPRRAVLVMHDLDGVRISEVARRLSVTRFGAYARLRKARRELATAVRRLLKGGGAR
jgi:RNA polymerase sigma-70 factor (ECF subfamily)